jgi:hypothetical protein
MQTETITIDPQSLLVPPLVQMTFKGKEIGRLDVKDGKLTFKGDVDESAQKFFDQLTKIWNSQPK